MNTWLPAFDAHYLLKRPNPYFKILVLSLGPKIIRMMSIPSYSPKSQRLQAKALLCRLAAGTLKRSGIAEQDALLIVHNLVQTYATKANWPVLTLVGRLDCSKNSFIKSNKKQIRPYGPESTRFGGVRP